MAYRFAGFFALTSTISSDDLLDQHVVRDVDQPFKGQGVLMPEYIGATPSKTDILLWSAKLRIDSADWMFIAYDCWAGHIDFVYAFGSCGDCAFGPIEEHDPDRTTDAFVLAMHNFGVKKDQALNFKPFERGFWD